jgi:hypothetical protein
VEILFYILFENIENYSDQNQNIIFCLQTLDTQIIRITVGNLTKKKIDVNKLLQNIKFNNYYSEAVKVYTRKKKKIPLGLKVANDISNMIGPQD